MKLKNEAKTKIIKVVLIGTNEEKKNFMAGCSSVQSLGVDCTYVKGKSEQVNYQIWDLAGADKLTSKMRLYIAGANAFIYLNATTENNEKFENIRDEKQCIAIDFNELNLTPIECVHEIENLITNYPIETKKQNDIKNNSFLLFQARADKKSILSILPKELIANICERTIASNVTFFGKSNKPVYIGLPKNPDVQETEKLENTDKAPDGCVLF